MFGEDWKFNMKKEDIFMYRTVIEDIMNEAVIFPLEWVFDSWILVPA